MTPTMFGDSNRVTSAFISIFTRKPVFTGLKSRTEALARRSSRSSPAIFSIAVTASPDAHDIRSRIDVLAPAALSTSDRGPPDDVRTTYHPYPVESFEWIRITPAAPRRAASSYLYV